MLTLDAVDFSSQTAIDAFRIGWITGRHAFESFFGANIMTNSIKMIIPSEVELIVIRLSTVPELMAFLHLRTVWVNSFMRSMGKAKPYKN